MKWIKLSPATWCPFFEAASGPEERQRKWLQVPRYLLLQPPCPSTVEMAQSAGSQALQWGALLSKSSVVQFLRQYPSPAKNLGCGGDLYLLHTHIWSKPFVLSAVFTLRNALSSARWYPGIPQNEWELWVVSIARVFYGDAMILIVAVRLVWYTGMTDLLFWSHTSLSQMPASWTP